MKTLVIVGAGAAGVFCATRLKGVGGLRVVVLESTSKPLQKLLLTGGGRCNFTNMNVDKNNPLDFYSRGGRNLRKPFRAFGATATRDYFQSLGVESKEEDFGRVFPTSDDAHTIADALMQNTHCEFIFNARAESVSKSNDDTWSVAYRHADVQKTIQADFVLFALGGSWQAELKESLERLSHNFEVPTPALFSFKTAEAGNADWSSMAGLSVQKVILSSEICGEKFSAEGAILITKFGVGGPAVLKLSSFAARKSAECEHKFELKVNWTGQTNPEVFRSLINNTRKSDAKKLIKTRPLFSIPRTLWEYLTSSIKIAEKTWANFSKADEKLLENTLCTYPIAVIGKSPHKEEFVTCGGVARECINFADCQSRLSQNIFFAGECIDIDAITGGFNLQAAWTTAYLVAEKIKTLV